MTTKDRVPWKLRAKGSPSRSALSTEQIQQLSETYSIDAGAFRELSRDVDIALGEELNLSQPALAKPKNAKGVREAQKAATALRSAEAKIAQARKTLDNLNFKNPYAHTGMPNATPHQIAELHAASDAISAFRGYLETMTRSELVTFRDVPDKRGLKDLRREIVITAVFNFWKAQGRSLTITTNPVNGERTGELARFVNEVVACLTDPPCQLPGETIFADLKAFKNPEAD